jgi:signal transduction histidine kinase
MPSTPLSFDFVVVYFIYGLAFFCMGLAIVLEARRSPVLAEARVLWPLAFFGLVHGTHEWLEIGLIVRQWFGILDPAYAPLVRLVLLVISFASLALYGLQVLRPRSRDRVISNVSIVLGILILYALLVLGTSLLQSSLLIHRFEHADALARYILAVPGAGMASLALFRQAQQARRAKQGFSWGLYLAGFGFGVYSLSQVLVSPVDIFPALYLNSALFLAWAGFPIQAIRAAMAVLVTIGLLRAIHMVEDERRRQLAEAQEARLEALEQVQRDLVEREALRRELLRHTVVAQEEERARIARELHDETSQFLSAMRLDLATLQNSLRQDAGFSSVLERLQTLSRQMSRGIYRMVRDLRPAQLDDLGLVAALNYLADEAKEHGMDIGVTVEGERHRLDPLVETVLFRIAQEALTNVTRHAGIREANVLIHYDDRQVSLVVQDQGVGFDPTQSLQPPHGWGLEGMRERAESVEGTLEIDSAPGRGTRVQVFVPLANEERRESEEGVYEHNPVDAGR